MNRIQSDSITLAWFVHQSFPLSLSLFILPTEAFIYLLAHQASQGLLKWIFLPNSQVHILNDHFANDSFLTLREDEKSITNALKWLDTFYLTSGYSVQ